MNPMPTFEEFKQANAGIMDELGKASGWMINQIWVQSKFLCEYCGADLLHDPQTYRSAESDHILPKFIYPLLEDKLSNYAMACSSCHKLKGRFDPGEGIENLRDLDGELDENQRRQLIETVQRALLPKRERLDAEMQRMRTIVAKHWRPSERRLW